jgi:enoyl-CoA hydratase/carnithine racemase
MQFVGHIACCLPFVMMLHRVGLSMPCVLRLAGIASLQRCGNHMHFSSSSSSISDDTASDAVVLRVDGSNGVTTLTLNRPQHLNSLSHELLSALQHQLADIQRTPRIKVVVLAAKGHVFSAGHDLKELQQHGRVNNNTDDGSNSSSSTQWDQAYVQQVFQQGAAVCQQVRNLSAVVVGVCRGRAAAAGAQLLLSSDLVLATHSASFSLSGITAIGLACSTPAVALSRVMPSRKCLEMLLTGSVMSAHDAHANGLVNHVVGEHDDLEQAVGALTDRLAAQSATALRIAKQTFYRQLEQPSLHRAYDIATTAMVDNIVTGEVAHGIDAFMAKRKPVWK